MSRYTMVEALLGWWPVLWTARVVLLIFLVGAGWCAFLYILRFFRPHHVLDMWNARLPRIRGASGTIAGQNIAVDLGQDEQLYAVEDRIEKLELKQKVSEQAIEDVVRFILREEAQYEFLSDKAPPHGELGAAEEGEP